MAKADNTKISPPSIKSDSLRSTTAPKLTGLKVML
jgi:hypothetical protein